MAPKKRSKTDQPSSSAGYDRTKFSSYEAQELFFRLVIHKPFIAERGFTMLRSTHAAARDLFDLWQWDYLCAEPEAAVKPVVREFYANYAQSETFSCRVRRCSVSVSEDTIRAFYDIPEVPDCAFRKYQENVEEPNLDEILSTITRNSRDGRYRTWKLARGSGEPTGIAKENLNKEARLWQSFVCSNLIPGFHKSGLNMDRVMLIYFLMTRRPLDAAYIISQNIKKVAQSGPSLSHPHLITALCAKAGVTWDPQEELLPPMTPIDERFLRKLGGSDSEDDASLSTPPSSPPPPSSPLPAPPPTAPVEPTHTELLMAHIHRSDAMHHWTFQTLTSLHSSWNNYLVHGLRELPPLPPAPDFLQPPPAEPSQHLDDDPPT